MPHQVMDVLAKFPLFELKFAQKLLDLLSGAGRQESCAKKLDGSNSSSVFHSCEHLLH